MKPEIEATQFGSIIIDGKTFEHDVIIRMDGEVKKRKKKEGAGPGLKEEEEK